MNYLLGLTILFWFSTLLLIPFSFSFGYDNLIAKYPQPSRAVLQTQIKTLLLSLQSWDILSKGFMYISMYLALYITFHITFPPFFSLSIGLCFSAVSGTLTSESIAFWNWGTPVLMTLKRILLTLDCLFKVNSQRSSSLDILIRTYTWMWRFLYKIHILYIHRLYIIYMHYIYYIYFKYIFICVYIYIYFLLINCHPGVSRTSLLWG